MKVRHWSVLGIVIFVLLTLILSLVLFVQNPVLMQPSGAVGKSQRDLFVLALITMSLVAIPVFLLLGHIAWTYRASNKRASYRPNWSSSRKLETLWWGIPVIVVCVLSVVAYQTSKSLDPFRPLDTSKHVEVQVVSLQWKWLFLYPEYGVASVNELVIPVDTPVAFSIAADSPMNSFWIPELGGQIYAMNGMSTKLHLKAEKIGEFKGLSSNISGEGFADMKFVVKSVPKIDYQTSLASHTGSPVLDVSQYEALAVPSVINEGQWFTLGDKQLYHYILNKYMSHSDNGEQTFTNDHGGLH